MMRLAAERGSEGSNYSRGACFAQNGIALRVKSVKTAKTIEKSLPLVAARRDHSTTLKLLSNYPQTTHKLPTTTPRRSPLLAISW